MGDRATRWGVVPEYFGYKGDRIVASAEARDAVLASLGATGERPPRAAPTFSPAAGTYSSTQSVTLSDATPGATIYYTTDAQRETAEETIADVNAAGLWPGKVVTEVAPAGPFWQAEPEHQDYLERIPNGYTCHFVRPGWRLPQRKAG